MERVTHSRRLVGSRVTRKRNNQKGAGQVVDVSGYFTEVKINAFSEALKTAGLPGDVITNIIKLFRYNTGLALTHVDIVDAWLLANKYQDVILQTGLAMIKNELKIVDMVIDESKHSAIRDMFTNLIPIIFFKEALPFEEVRVPAADSKFETMFKAPVANNEITELLLYPKRIENLLVQSVAEIIVMLSTNNELNNIVSKLDAITRPLLIDKWSIFSRGFCTIQINKFEIRDNFPTCREPIKQEMVTSFWTQFIFGMQTDLSGNITLPKGSDANKDLNDALGFLSGCYAKWYCTGKQGDFYSMLKIPSSNLVTEKNNMEDAPQIGATNLITSATLGGIFDKLLVQTVTYLKHLEGSVERIKSMSTST